MLLLIPLITALLAHSSLGVASPPKDESIPKPAPWGFFVNNTIYQPTAGQSITYPRFAELRDGTILATASLSGPSPAYFPVFESLDGGASWSYISNVTDQANNGWGMSAQPALAELTEALGGYAAGTILAAGNSWSDEGTRIDLYASTDRARTWEFVSRVAEGGRPNTTNGADPIWEPYLLPYNSTLICYYSDQRDPAYGQKLAHQVSADLVSWGPVVDDVAYSDSYLARPGMTVVQYIPAPYLDRWILVYELPVGDSSSHGSHYPVYYALATSPLDFRFSVGQPIIVVVGAGAGGNATQVVVPNASPYVTWTPAGGGGGGDDDGGKKYGTIVVSDADNARVYTNRFGGDVDKWEAHDTPAGATYSRAVHVLGGRPDHLMIFGGEIFDNLGAGLLTPFTATVVNVTEMLDN
ncbi:glycoside hydrolase family 93 protein [Xylariomycetidae sp. FL2044]|nr:glycoside hydrolase family 93 protein [Xylariomycetidae sp. FL2044]